MEIAHSTAPVGNLDRHARIIAAWQLAQVSPSTLSSYTRNLSRYCAWLDSHGLDLLDVKRVHVDGYRHALVGAPSSAAGALSAISSFYSYAMAEDATDRNPAQAVRRPKVDADHSSTQGLDVDQARALLTAARADGKRSFALVSLLLFTGVRISEALNATEGDYAHDSGHRVLKITRKGGARGNVVVPAPAVVALNDYLGTSGEEIIPLYRGANTTPIFTTRTGSKWQRSEAFRAIVRLSRKAGITGTISPHSLRHTFATIALANGTSLHHLQDSMGHADPRTTRRYDRSRNNLAKSAGYDVARALA